MEQISGSATILKHSTKLQLVVGGEALTHTGETNLIMWNIHHLKALKHQSPTVETYGISMDLLLHGDLSIYLGYQIFN